MVEQSKSSLPSNFSFNVTDLSSSNYPHNTTIIAPQPSNAIQAHLRSTPSRPPSAQSTQHPIHPNTSAPSNIETQLLTATSALGSSTTSKTSIPANADIQSRAQHSHPMNYHDDKDKISNTEKDKGGYGKMSYYLNEMRKELEAEKVYKRDKQIELQRLRERCQYLEDAVEEKSKACRMLESQVESQNKSIHSLTAQVQELTQRLGALEKGSHPLAAAQNPSAIGIPALSSSEDPSYIISASYSSKNE
jgi:archaellum component FlaC